MAPWAGKGPARALRALGAWVAQQLASGRAPSGAVPTAHQQAVERWQGEIDASLRALRAEQDLYARRGNGAS